MAQLASELRRRTNLDRIRLPGISGLQVSDDRHRVPLSSPLKSSLLCLFLVPFLLSSANLFISATTATPFTRENARLHLSTTWCLTPELVVVFRCDLQLFLQERVKSGRKVTLPTYEARPLAREPSEVGLMWQRVHTVGTH